MAGHDKARGGKILALFMVLNYCVLATSEANVTESLLKFKSSLSNNGALGDWNASVSPCNGNVPQWTGLRCKDDVVFGLKLENKGLTGVIDVDSLVELPGLRTLSFMHNSFDGPMPDVKKLTSLRVLYLSFNNFRGQIPDDAFIGMNSLMILHLARNQFSGEIPKSVTLLPKLTELNLEGNHFEGEIPDFPQKSLTMVNLANNNLTGGIPDSLSGMSSSYFSGNELCGKPLSQCKSRRRTIIITVVVAAVGVALAAPIAAVLYLRSRRAPTAYTKQDKDMKAVDYKKEENAELHFVKTERERFELQDLLRASAEVLGSGSFGSSYKAVLLDRPAMVVKRFRHMDNVGKKTFYEHMAKLGRLSHPNLLSVVAFYYRKEEKLLVSDFVQNGSLANLLHTKLGPNQPGLNWTSRLKIIKGVARGLAYLYKEFPSSTLPHGHLKSSNVLLDQNYEPVLTDYALVPVMNKEHAQQLMVAYKSPEFTQHDYTTRKTDVWSLGILILELLTGKFPANYLKQGKGANADLAAWVNSVVREEWTGEVFDKDMKGTKNGEVQMLKLLKIGMCCCEWDVEKRWELREAVEKIEELKEKDSDMDDYSSYASEGEVYSSRATEDDFSFPVSGAH